jgi:hypothetical protein
MSRLQVAYSHQDLPHHRFRGDVASSTSPVFDNELLAKSLGEHLSGHPRHDVIDAAGSIADQQNDRPRRICLGSCDTKKHRKRGSARCQLEKSTAGNFHGFLSVCPSDVHNDAQLLNDVARTLVEAPGLLCNDREFGLFRATVARIPR